MRDNFWTKDEAPFQVERMTLIIGESVSGYTLQCSVDYKEGNEDAHWADCSDAIPAGKQHLVSPIAAGTWFRLRGNRGDVYLRW